MSDNKGLLECNSSTMESLSLNILYIQIPFVFDIVILESFLQYFKYFVAAIRKWKQNLMHFFVQLHLPFWEIDEVKIVLIKH